MRASGGSRSATKDHVNLSAATSNRYAVTSAVLKWLVCTQACDCAGTPCGAAAAPPPPDAGVGEQCPQGTMTAGRAHHADCGRRERTPEQTLPPDGARVPHGPAGHPRA